MEKKSETVNSRVGFNKPEDNYFPKKPSKYITKPRGDGTEGPDARINMTDPAFFLTEDSEAIEEDWDARINSTELNMLTLAETKSHTEKTL